MKKNGSRKEKARVAKNTAMKMLSMPFCAYWVQMATTFLLSDTEAFSVLSSLMLALMNSTARYAPVETACVEAPANQKITAPPVTKPRKKGACSNDNISLLTVRPWV